MDNLLNSMQSAIFVGIIVCAILVLIVICLVIAIFQINNNVKSIKDYLLRDEYIEDRRLEPQEDWIYETKGTLKPNVAWIYADKMQKNISEVAGTKKSIWKKKLF